MVCEAEFLCFYIFIERDIPAGDLFLEFDEVPDLGEEPHVDLCLFVDLGDINASSDRLSNVEESLVSRSYAALHKVFVCHFFHLLKVKCVGRDLCASYGLHERALK